VDFHINKVSFVILVNDAIMKTSVWHIDINARQPEFLSIKFGLLSNDLLDNPTYRSGVCLKPVWKNFRVGYVKRWDDTNNGKQNALDSCHLRVDKFYFFLHAHHSPSRFFLCFVGLAVERLFSLFNASK